MDQIGGSSSSSSSISHRRESAYDPRSNVCEHLSQMLGCDEITYEEKLILKNFHSRAAVRLQQIFDSKRHCDRFICTIRGSNREASSVSSDESVSTFETLFHDTLKDIQVLFFNVHNLNLC